MNTQTSTQSSPPAAAWPDGEGFLAGLCARYGLEMDPNSVPGLVERFDLRFPGEPDVAAHVRT